MISFAIFRDHIYFIRLVKFDKTFEHDTKLTQFLRVLVENNRVLVISVCLINGSYSC